jgi:hypothetical protein
VDDTGAQIKVRSGVVKSFWQYSKIVYPNDCTVSYIGGTDIRIQIKKQARKENTDGESTEQSGGASKIEMIEKGDVRIYESETTFYVSKDSRIKFKQDTHVVFESQIQVINKFGAK